MRKIYEYCDDKGVVTEFLNNAHPKLKNKFVVLLQYIQKENGNFCEPYIKHFSIERFKMFYEIRLKHMKTIVRIIFTEIDGNIILLHAFYKKNKRDTQMALEQTLKLFLRLDDKSLLPFENLREVTFQ